MRFRWLLLGLPCLLAAVPARAQTSGGEARATALQSNVVKIAATLTQGGVPQVGFGFIVGEQGNQLVVVTADHVVRGADADGKEVQDSQPVLTFFESQGYQVRGALQNVRLPRDRGDLTVILVPRPGFVRFETAALSMQTPSRGTQVWLVGRGGEWNIPTSPGTVAQYDPFGLRIKVENLPVTPGSSGGPLISADGIVGMIVTDTGLVSEAVPIEPIQRQVRDVWRYAWQLTPFTPPPPPAAPPAPDRSVDLPPLQGTAPSLPVPVPAQPRPQVSRGPSYPCAKATAPVEVLICHDATLAGLDVELDGVYQALRARLDAKNQRLLLSAEAEWVNARNNCANAGDANEVRACVMRAYRSRIDFLRTF